MNIKFDLGSVRAFQWQQENNIRLIGYFAGDIQWRMICKHFYNVRCFTEADRKFLNELNGCFALIVETDQEFLIVADKVRSFPIYYYVDEDAYFVSDSPSFQLNAGLGWNQTAFYEFQHSGYTLGEKTVLNGVYQVQAGECVILKKEKAEVIKETYFEFRHRDTSNDTMENLADAYGKVIESVFARMIKTVAPRQIVVPLSGGQDSRLIAVMLHKLHYKNVLCFTYGMPENHESKISRMVAEKLGYQWYFCKYSEKGWRAFFRSPVYQKYLEYASGLSSLACLQQTPALLELLSQGLVENEAVFVPGHAGDMIAGSHVPQICLAQNRGLFLHKDLISHLMNSHFSLMPFGSLRDKKALFYAIAEELNIEQGYTSSEFADEVEFFDWRERQSKFIVNDVRNYDFMGYEWRLPLWDNEIISFWSHVPVEMRVDRTLYWQFAQKYVAPYLEVPPDRPPDYNAKKLQWKWRLKDSPVVQPIRWFLACMRRFSEFQKDGCGFYSWLSAKEYFLKMLAWPFGNVNAEIIADRVQQLEQMNKR